MGNKKNIELFKLLALFMTFWFVSQGTEAQQLYPANFDVTTLNGTNGFVIPGFDTVRRLGTEVQFIGDVNNDGLEDICVGNGNENVGPFDLAGRAYVIFGSTTDFSTPFDLTSLDGTNGFVVESIGFDERRGSTVAGPGDINGDGIDDLIIGSSNTSADDIVIYGGTTFPAVMTVNDINGANGFLIDTPGSNQVAALGDVNDDGINDFIIGTPHFSGQSWIIFGRSSDFPASINVSWLDGVNGFRTSRFLGSRPSYKVGGAGDINDDGINDILIGNWGSSVDPSGQISYALFGKSTPFDPLVDIEAVDGTDGFLINNQGNGFLTFVGPIGDINNDGIDDCFSENNIILGSTGPFSASLLMSDLDGSNGFVLNDYVICAAPTGDLNLDGIDDFIVAASDDYVVFGTTGGFPAVFDSATLDGTNGFQITTTNSNIGRPIDGGRDMNGDGLADFIFGDRNGGSGGEAYVVFGGDHYALPLNTDYPRAINETLSGFTLEVNGPETGTIYYAIYPGSFSGTLDHGDILNGTGATTNGNFLMNAADTDIQEVISSLTADTTYDVYLFLEDGAGNQGEIYFIDNVTTLSTVCPYTVPCEERDALIALYNATDGINWTTNMNWLTTNPVDTWFGVTVSGGHVTEIDFGFSGNNLNGTLPTELEDLNFLEKFIMPRNSSLTGSIPNELFTNVSLVEIDLGNNGLTGSIPVNVSNLIALRSLELDNNSFSGVIPNEIYALTNLEVFNLYGNDLSGPISTDIRNLTQLTTLSIGDNPIGGTIPIEIGDLINLIDLNIYRADLTGSIPIEIGNLINLRSLQLSRNALSGNIPASLGNLVQLTSLYLSDNNLTGSIPASLGNLTNVRLFLLGPNELTGSIPPELGALINVESFYLYDNNLSGSIPPELGGLTSVTQLYLSNNELEGTIPASLATLPNVEDIFFRNNNLSGSFPDFTQASNLNYRILMDGNAFQFGDFENQWNAYQSQLSIFDDSPQDNVNLEETINTNVGSNITLTTLVSGSQNNYQWYRNGVLIPGATNQNLVLNNVQLADAGDYYSIITSDIVTDLTLRRNDIHLVISSTSDTEDPTASNPSPINVQCTSNIPAPDPLVVTDEADNSGIPPIVAFEGDVSDGNSNPEVITRTYSVTDGAGNSINVTQTIIVDDITNPTASNPVGITVVCTADIPAEDITVVTDEADNCGTPTVTFAGDVSTGPGVITRTYSVTDDAGNSINVTQTITINDTTDPIIDCPTNITQNVDIGLSTAVVTYSTPVGIDNCVVSSVIQISGLPSGAEFPIGTTTNTFEVTDDAGNSTSCSFDVIITNNPLITCEIDAGEDEQIIEGREVQLNATASTQGNFIWSPSTGLSDTSIVNPIANPTETTTYSVVFTGDNGCTAEDLITVFVTPIDEDETQYGFSPDGDGINEFWEIDNIENYPNNKVSIFNRWGDLVFEVEGYDNLSRVFRGIATRKRGIGGDLLPEGTYFFNIKIEGAHRLKKLNGFIVLKR